MEPAWLAGRITQYFSRLGGIVSTLAEMAELQRTGALHSGEHVAFIKQAIRIEGGGSGDPWQTGWYKDLFFDPSDGLKFDPTIADVHTDPGGPFPVSRGPSVLHVGTGLPRPMVVSVQTCGPVRGREPTRASCLRTTSDRRRASRGQPTTNGRRC